MFLDDDVYGKVSVLWRQSSAAKQGDGKSTSADASQWIDVGVADAIETGHAQKIYLNVHDVDPFKAPNEDNVIEQVQFYYCLRKLVYYLVHAKIKQAATKSDGAEAEQKKKIDRIHGAGVVTKAQSEAAQIDAAQAHVSYEAQDTLPGPQVDYDEHRI